MNNDEQKIQRSIGKEIGILSRSAHKYFQLLFKDFSIGHAQVMTLHHISKNNGLSQNELVQYFNLDKSSVTSQLNSLEKNGYITRKVDTKDSRSRRIFVSEKTKSIETDLHQKFSGWGKILLEGFDEQEREQTFLFLDRLKENAAHCISEMRIDEEKK